MQRERKIKILYASLLNLCLLTAPAVAQDSLHYRLGIHTAVASQDYLPHWSTANRFGVLDDGDYALGWLRGAATYHRPLTKQVRLEVGLDLLTKVPFAGELSPRLRLQQGYVRLRYGIFELGGGWQQRTLGTQADGLTTGSLSVSGNARPIPQVLFAVPEYSAVPYTRGYVEFKGTFAHGWMGDDRFVRGAWLHQKSLFVRGGGSFWLNGSVGLVHNVVWGGTYPGVGQLPNGLSDFWQVIRGEGAKNVDLNNPVLLGEASALGDNLGVYDFSLLFKAKNYHVLVYHQTPFEDKTGSRLTRNRDRLLGINLTVPKANHWIESVVYEYLYTKYQSGPTIPGAPNGPPADKFGNDFGGRDNYYNNAVYKTGWVHAGRIIGTPLFFTEARMRHYVPGFVEPDDSGFNFNVVNNRVVAHHVGVKGVIKRVGYRLLSTFSTNYGTYGGINGGIGEWGSIDNPDAPYAFRPPQRQSYFLLEIESHPFSPQWSLLTSVAVDAGELTDNVGVLVGLRREGVWMRERAKDRP